MNFYRAGFTLVELSIVLVIIGLIISGVLVGRDLIQTASIRAAISQIDGITSAVNTFRGKYGGIPGDLYYSTAQAFGLTYITGGGTGKGDGNSLLLGGAVNAYTTQSGELTLFWRQLYDVGLISTGGAITTDGSTAITSSTDILSCFPPSKLRGNYLLVYSTSSGLNYMELTGITTNGASPTLANNLKPQEAYGIDLKIDDGIPITGSIIAGNNAAINGGLDQSGASGWCAHSNVYEVDRTDNYCQLRVRI